MLRQKRVYILYKISDENMHLCWSAKLIQLSADVFRNYFKTSDIEAAPTIANITWNSKDMKMYILVFPRVSFQPLDVLMWPQHKIIQLF